MPTRLPRSPSAGNSSPRRIGTTMTSKTCRTRLRRCGSIPPSGSPTDSTCARRLLGLYELGQDPRLRPTLEILTLADQIGVDRERFPYVGFKGGSEIGVFAGNWLLVRNDGRRFVMTFALNDHSKGLDPQAVVDTFQPAANVLLYETP